MPSLSLFTRSRPLNFLYAAHGRSWRRASGAFALSLGALAAPAWAQPGVADTTFGPYGTGWGETIVRFATSIVALDGIVLPNDENLIGGVCTVTTAPPAVGTHFCIQKMAANGGIVGVPGAGGAIYLKDSGTTLNQCQTVQAAPWCDNPTARFC